MAISESYDILYDRDDIITEALELIGAISAGETPSSEDIASCTRTLNMMIKFWQSKGIAVWRNQEIYVFLTPSAKSYQIGPSGTARATTSFSKTEVAVAAASGESTITVDSDDDISASDKIGVELDDGTLHWTTVNGAPAANVVTLTAALTDDVSVDANVYTYTTVAQRPLFITEARLHRDSGTELPINRMAGNDYKALSTKTSTGKASQFYYDPQTINGVLYVWPTADSVKDYLVCTARMPLADFDATDDDPDFPQEWLLPLAYNLAILIAPKYGEDVTPAFEAKAVGMLAAAAESTGDEGSMILELE